MTREKKTTDAVAILHSRYVKDKPGRRLGLEAEHLNATVARMIYDLRKNAGISQAELAELVGTTQSAISRLEDADYEGHSLTMLQRIALALQQRVTVEMTAKDSAVREMLYAFQLCMRMLRRAKGLTVDQLARKLEMDQEEIVRMERSAMYRPSSLVLSKLSRFYGVPERRILMLAGAVKRIPQTVRQRATRFAAQSESCTELTGGERKALDDFVRFLRQEG